VNVACGDIEGDGMDEIVTGAGPGAVFGPHARGFNYDGIVLTPVPGASFIAYGTRKYGVNVGSGDLDGNGRDDFLTGPGPGSTFTSHLRGWIYESGQISPMPGVSFFAYADPGYGVRLGTGNLDGDQFDEILTVPGPGDALHCRVRGWNVDGGTAEAIAGIDFLAYGGAFSYGGNVTAATE
jgi:hypothetical protein